MQHENPTPLRPVTAPKTGLRKTPPIAKAARLISEDRVMLAPDAQVYRVLGDTGTYNVIVDEERGIVCPCNARTPLCSHVIAVALIRQRGKPAPERLVKDLGVAS